MNIRIAAALKEAGQKYGIEILYACESGSRAWGFPSPDSDYDVRFIYKRSLSDYLCVQPDKDQINFPITDELDLYGWDIKKVLQLMYKSNCTPFEWLQSPTIYMEQPGFRDGIMRFLPQYFSARTQACHYLGIAKGAMEAMCGEYIKIKKLFYILRPILAARWIIEKDQYPPMNIEPMLAVAPIHIQEAIVKLIMGKQNANETFLIRPSNDLLIFIRGSMEELTERSGGLSRSYFDITQLDDYFKQCVQ